MNRLCLALTCVLFAVSCDPGWTYLVRHPGGEPPGGEAAAPASTDDAAGRGWERVQRWSLAGGRVHYALSAHWFSLDAIALSRIRNDSSVPLRIRVDRARVVLGNGLSLAPEVNERLRREAVIVPPGETYEARRVFGPLAPEGACSGKGPLQKIRFIDEGLELDGEPVEASFELERTPR